MPIIATPIPAAKPALAGSFPPSSLPLPSLGLGLGLGSGVIGVFGGLGGFGAGKGFGGFGSTTFLFISFLAEASNLVIALAKLPRDLDKGVKEPSSFLVKDLSSLDVPLNALLLRFKALKFLGLSAPFLPSFATIL